MNNFDSFVKSHGDVILSDNEESLTPLQTIQWRFFTSFKNDIFTSFLSQRDPFGTNPSILVLLENLWKLFANHEGFLRNGISMRKTVIRFDKLLLAHDFAIGIPYWESRGLIFPGIFNMLILPEQIKRRK